MIAALVFAVLAIFPTGDRNGDEVTKYQPVKLAAMEGLFKSTQGAPLAIIGMPDSSTQTLIDPIFVPDMLSFLAYGNFTTNVKGLSAYATALWPPIDLMYYAYHVMVGLGTIFAGIAGLCALFLWRKRLFQDASAAMAVVARDAFPVHRQRSRMGNDRGRASTVDRVRLDANGESRFRRPSPAAKSSSR